MSFAPGLIAPLPRKLALRFPAGPDAAAKGFVTGVNILGVVRAAIGFLQLEPDDLVAQHVEAGGRQLALLNVAEPHRPRIAAFVSGLDELELNLALAWWAEHKERAA